MRYLPYCLLAATLLVPLSTLPGQEAAESSPWPDISRPETTDATSRKIIGLHLKARGGAEELRGFHGLKVEGELIEGKLDYRIEGVYRPPVSLIIKSTRRHLGDDHVQAMATVGGSAWQQKMLPKRELPGPLGKPDKRLLDLDAMLPFLFLDLDDSGHVFAYRGEDTFAGQKAYVVHGWLANGLRVETLFDSKSFQIINFRHLYRIGPSEVLVDRVPTGLMRVDSTWWDSGYEFRLRGKTFRKVRYDKVTQLPDPGTKLFQEPPTNERWLVGPSTR